MVKFGESNDHPHESCEKQVYVFQRLRNSQWSTLVTRHSIINNLRGTSFARLALVMASGSTAAKECALFSSHIESAVACVEQSCVMYS